MWVFIAGPFINSTMMIGDVNFNSVMNESDLADYGVSSGSIIALNGVYDKEVFVEDLLNLSSNESVNLTIDSGGVLNTYEVTTFDNPQRPGKGMIGISGLEFNFTNKEGYGYLGNSPLYFEKLLFYFWLLNIGIGIMNLLPLWITDGGQIARTLLLKYVGEKRALLIYNLVSLVSLVLILFILNPAWLISILNLF
jgi:membrane-associated protease RseP (regulator of RpoE activity)